MRIDKISSYNKRYDNGVQSTYTIINDNIIMLNDINVNTHIEPHKHPHKQFEYCFSGTYDIYINAKKITISEKQGYLINGSQPHSYRAATAVYAFCFKYLGHDSSADVLEMPFEKVQIEESHSIDQISLETVNVYKIRIHRRCENIILMPELKGCFYCVVSVPTRIDIGNFKTALLPMGIYMIDTDGKPVQGCFESASEMLLLKEKE